MKLKQEKQKKKMSMKPNVPTAGDERLGAFQRKGAPKRTAGERMRHRAWVFSLSACMFLISSSRRYQRLPEAPLPVPQEKPSAEGFPGLSVCPFPEARSLHKGTPTC